MTRPKQQASKEQWFAVCDKVTGAAVSFGTVLGELAANFEAVPIPGQPSARLGTKWDSSTRTVVDLPPPAPAPDRVGELLDDPVVTAVVAKLSAGERAALAEKLRAKFGGN